ncbi:hypothetical protein [Roseicella frigidaeris]|nr:hypothetical protein [Roseicella frigidaeris]
MAAKTKTLPWPTVTETVVTKRRPSCVTSDNSKATEERSPLTAVLTWHRASLPSIAA